MSRIRKHTTWAAALPIVALLGCATVPPSAELVEARKIYDQASKSAAKQQTPDQLLTAKQALDRAERANRDKPRSALEKHLASVAQRRAMMAMIAADQALAARQRDAAEAEYIEIAERQRLAAKRGLAATLRELSDTERELQAVRGELHENLAAAMQSLKEIGNVKAEEQGWVLTLSGAVLFATGKHELMPIAKQMLDRVADALAEADDDKTYVIEGHTDSRGPDDFNMDLSQKRSDAVRSYLISQGIDPNRITAVGKGETEPVADNATAEGRANNRRVEIHVR